MSRPYTFLRFLDSASHTPFVCVARSHVSAVCQQLVLAGQRHLCSVASLLAVSWDILMVHLHTIYVRTRRQELELSLLVVYFVVVRS